jgi:hypothetical protein
MTLYMFTQLCYTVPELQCFLYKTVYENTVQPFSKHFQGRKHISVTCNGKTFQSPLRGLLDRSTAQYFYERLKTSLHKPTGNLLENLFSKQCTFNNNLQLLEKKFLSQLNTIPKNGILLNKMAQLLKSSIFQ